MKITIYKEMTTVTGINVDLHMYHLSKPLLQVGNMLLVADVVISEEDFNQIVVDCANNIQLLLETLWKHPHNTEIEDARERDYIEFVNRIRAASK